MSTEHLPRRYAVQPFFTVSERFFRTYPQKSASYFSRRPAFASALSDLSDQSDLSALSDLSDQSDQSELSYRASYFLSACHGAAFGEAERFAIVSA